MKIKVVSKVVKVRCDVCGAEHVVDPDSRGSAFHGHKMIVVSIHDDSLVSFKNPNDHRKYYDICSMKCLARFSTAVITTED